MKLITNWKYHLLNGIGWQLYVLSTLTFDKLSYGISNFEEWIVAKHNLFYYLISEGVLCAFLGFILSNIVLLFIELKIDFKKTSRPFFIGLVLNFTLAQVLYHLLLWPMLSVPLKYYLNEELKLTFLMKLANVPAFTVSFLVWLFVVMTYKVIKYLKEIRIKQLELEFNIKESTLNSLKGQINPHFMFNTLNNIRGLILEDPSRSRDMITRLSEMLRYSLTKNECNEIKLEEELEMVVNYIQISKIQFEDRLQYVEEIAPETLNIKIPPMILQILVENAVKHGISNLKAGGLVKLVAKTEDKFLKVTVVNSGKLLIQSNSTQIGLKNILSRLQLLYGELAFFEIIEVNQMVEARVVIPLNDENGKN